VRQTDKANCLPTASPALAGEAVILFERYEQKDKSGSGDQPEAGNAQVITIKKAVSEIYFRDGL
jgi:hypothetical protein